MSQALHPETRELQAKLAAYCRDGVEPSLEGVTPNRIPEYRRLVFNVIRDALSNTYPLTKNLLNEKEWAVLVHRFFEEHTCLDPQVWRMPYELIGYVKEHRGDLIQKHPLLPELLWFEWLELEYYMMPDKQWNSGLTKDFWNDAWNVSPESDIIELTHPLHLKNAKFISRTDQGTYTCLIYRQPETFKVRFMNLSPLLAWILNQQKEGNSLYKLEAELTEWFGISDINEIMKQIEPFFLKLKKDGVVK